MIASAKDAHRLLRLRRFNLIACCIGAAVIGRIAAGPSWAGTLFALWSALPLLIGYYGLSQAEVASVLRHLLGLEHVTVEDREVVEQALANSDSGVDFADALHHAS